MSDSVRATTVAGIIVSVLLFISFMYVVNTPFPADERAHYPSQSVSTSDPNEIGPSMSGFLWGYKGFDLLMQTLVLFATSICCLAMLRREPGESR
jgi:hypothetical protein